MFKTHIKFSLFWWLKKSHLKHHSVTPCSVTLSWLPLKETTRLLGPVKTWCFCRTELNSEIKTKARQRHGVWIQILIKHGKAIKNGKLCRAKRHWHGSDSEVVLLPSLTKFIFVRWLQYNLKFGTTLTQRLKQSRISIVLLPSLLNCNLVRHRRSKTPELGLIR